MARMPRTREEWQPLAHLNGEQGAKEWGRTLGEPVDSGNFRRARRKAIDRYPSLPWVDAPNVPPKDNSGGVDPKDAYGVREQRFADGSRASDRLIEILNADDITDEFLLAAHGFDPDEWEIVSATSNMWQGMRSKEHGNTLATLYQSKLTVRPKAECYTVADFAAAMRACADPVKVTMPRTGAGLLELGVTDAHFGNSTLDTHRPALSRGLALIGSKRWADVVLWVGSDLFHCDNFKNTTSNGTPQSSVDWPSAWADALSFYSALIESALANARAVYCYYIIGNHDESMSWAFCQMLAAKYPQVRFDLAIEERKVHRFGEVAIGMTHGDNKTRRDLDRIFVSEFPDTFACAAVREVHAGHYHHEVSVDQFGVVTRSLSTKARTDKWHREEGFVGAMKRFMCFEYEPDALCAVHYI